MDSERCTVIRLHGTPTTLGHIFGLPSGFEEKSIHGIAMRGREDQFDTLASLGIANTMPPLRRAFRWAAVEAELDAESVSACFSHQRHAGGGVSYYRAFAGYR